MPVAVIDVPRAAWNNVAVSAAIHGLSICPEDPYEGESTVVEVEGSKEKLVYMLGRCYRYTHQPKVLYLAEILPIDECK
jgi:hypothetical protein